MKTAEQALEVLQRQTQSGMPPIGVRVNAEQEYVQAHRREGVRLRRKYTRGRAYKNK